MPTQNEWAWLAGIIDGEGSIGLQRCPKNIKPPNHERLQKYQRALELHRAGFGARRIARTLGLPHSTVSGWLYRDEKPRTPANPHGAIYTPYITIVNTDLPLLEKARKIMNCGSISIKPAKWGWGKKPAYYLRIYGVERVLAILRATLPHLTAKRARAETVIKACEWMINTPLNEKRASVEYHIKIKKLYDNLKIIKKGEINKGN